MNRGLSVIIPSTGNIDSLKKLFLSVGIQDLVVAEFEILLILNGMSEINFLEIKKALFTNAFPVKFIFITQKGANIARNTGIKSAAFPILLFLDDDCSLLDRGFFSAHLKLHSQKPELFAVGGGYLAADDSRFFDRLYNYLQMKWFVLGSISGTTRFLLGGNFSAKAEVLESTGLQFDNAIAYGGSEYEFFVRACDINLKMETCIFDVIHRTHENVLSLTKKIHKQGRGGAIIELKYPGRSSVGAKSITDPQQSLVANLFFVYFNYVFWAGYYSHMKTRHKLIGRLGSDLLNAVNYYRYKLLGRITREISDKDRRF